MILAPASRLPRDVGLVSTENNGLSGSFTSFPPDTEEAQKLSTQRTPAPGLGKHSLLGSLLNPKGKGLIKAATVPKNGVTRFFKERFTSRPRFSFAVMVQPANLALKVQRGLLVCNLQQSLASDLSHKLTK
jgi:hypothetical protein